MKVEWIKPKEKRLSHDEAELFKILYLKGVDRNEIARILGITLSAVKQRIRRQGLANRITDFNQEKIDAMFSMWQDRLTTGQIAIRMNLTKKQVYYQLKKMCLVG